MMGTERSDRLLLQQIQLGWLEPIFFWSGVVLDALSIGTLLYPGTETVTICLINLGRLVVLSSVMTVLILWFPLVFQKIGIQRRALQGRPPMTQASLTFISSPIVIIVIQGLMLSFYWIMMSILLSSQDYFESFRRTIS